MYRLDRRRLEPARLRGDFLFGYPRAAVDAQGVMHVVWAEPDTSDRRGLNVLNLVRARFTTLWHASFREGRWTAPAIIYRAQRLRWAPMFASDLVATSSGMLVLALAADPEGDRPGVIAYLQLRGDAWSVRELSLATRAHIYVDVATAGANLAVVAYVAANPAIETLQSSNTVFVVRSVDGGETWSSPAPVSRPGQGLAYLPRIVVDASNTLHLMWVAGESGKLAVSAMLHLTSTDGSLWTDSPSLPLSGLIVQSQAVVDKCNTIHVLITRLANGRPGLQHVRFVPGHDPSAESLFPDWTGSALSPLIDANRLRLVWEGVPVRQPIEDSPRAIVPIATLYSDIQFDATGSPSQR
ncbi:MAG TPA: sialidase family protein [Gemmatimonadaceae bacterium]|nr:sialidase family protein [Gemmatimonadaceae bacterium]